MCPFSAVPLKVKHLAPALLKLYDSLISDLVEKIHICFLLKFSNSSSSFQRIFYFKSDIIFFNECSEYSEYFLECFKNLGNTLIAHRRELVLRKNKQLTSFEPIQKPMKYNNIQI